jgi:hypothetical protein
MHDASVICHTFFYVCDSVASFNIQQRKKIRSCKHQKKTMTYDVRNPGPSLGQSQKCGGV